MLGTGSFRNLVHVVSAICTSRGVSRIRYLCRATPEKYSWYMSAQEIEHNFPIIAGFNKCGASVVVCKFPYDTEVPSLDFNCLEKIDKYTPTMKGIHPKKVLAFHGGRIALRHALKGVSAMPIPSIGRSPRGAPVLPLPVVGSISHKDNLAVACALLHQCCEKDTHTSHHSATLHNGHLGVDIEYRCLSKPASFMDRFAVRVLTEKENDSLGAVKGLSVDEEVMLRFSLKEAVYKSIEPVLRRHVSYKEIEVQPHVDGTATVVSKLEDSTTTFSSVAQWFEFTPPSTSPVRSASTSGDDVVKEKGKYWVSCVHSFDFYS